MKNSIVFIFSLLIFLPVFGQKKELFKKDFLKSKFAVRKAGPFIGVEFGKYTSIAFGGEVQLKELKLIRPKTHALNLGFDYNFKQKVVGYSLGYWFKQGRLNLTYGANLMVRSNFHATRFGGGPAIGFKFAAFHLQTGYNFLTNPDSFANTNQLYVSLRFVMMNVRNYKWRKNK